MALSVATNIGALAASKAASSVNSSMETSMARLSSGKRINSAADDSAGLAIASRLTSEARGLDMAARNAADAQAMINTIESAHNEIHNILQRMRELAVQGANDTNGTDDRANIRRELTELHEEIDAIKNQTKWAGQTLISAAGGSTFKFQIGDEKDEQLTVATTQIASSSLSVGSTQVGSLTSSATFSAFVTTSPPMAERLEGERAAATASSTFLCHLAPGTAPPWQKATVRHLPLLRQLPPPHSSSSSVLEPGRAELILLEEGLLDLLGPLDLRRGLPRLLHGPLPVVVSSRDLRGGGVAIGGVEGRGGRRSRARGLPQVAPRPVRICEVAGLRRLAEGHEMRRVEAVACSSWKAAARCTSSP